MLQLKVDFMLHKIFNRINPLFKRNFTLLNNNSRTILSNPSHFARRTIVPTFVATGSALFMPAAYFMQDKEQNKHKEENNTPSSQNMEKKEPSFLQNIWTIFTHIVRFFHLLIIFTPPIFLSPLLFFKSTRSFWMDCFVRSIQRAGVVFIKAFQYLSHRRDMIGPELADKVQYLRERAPVHSIQTTRKNFKLSYGRNIQDIFQDFDPVPIASGSVSQVYRAKYKGKKVAVKVRHPNVDTYIQRDVNLMFFMSYLASFFSPAMDLPISQTSLKKTLTQQIDFTFEMKNLYKFNQMFKNNRDINFPAPVEQQTIDSVLVQTFIQGVAVTYYEKKPHVLNKVMARMGSTTFFQMLFKNNFIHADCHGGNIFVQIKQQSYCMLSQIQAYISQLMFRLQTKIKSLNFDTQRLKHLYLQSRQQELNVMKLLRKYKQKITVNLIDVGMVIQLNQTDKKNFVNFIKSIIEGNGQICAQMIYKLSNFEGKKIMEGKFQDYYSQLQKCFSILNQQTLEEVEGINIFVDMLQIIRQNRMKLDGEFATLLTNMIVLESVAKSLDPDIKILKCAFPYFKYVQGISLTSK